MTANKVTIEITSKTVSTLVFDDGKQVATHTWTRVGPGSWRGGREDFYGLLSKACPDDCESELDELAEALEDLDLTSVGRALGNVNGEEFDVRKCQITPNCAAARPPRMFSYAGNGEKENDD